MVFRIVVLTTLLIGASGNACVLDANKLWEASLHTAGFKANVSNNVGSCEEDIVASCPTATCGLCGKSMLGCLGSKCPGTDYDAELTDCSGGLCHYNCKCRNPQPPTPPPPPTPPSPPPAGEYAVNHGKIKKVPGLGGSAVIFWPTPKTADEKFPILTFAHGTGVGGAFAGVTVGYMTILSTVVSKGFIVVAPETCPVLECASAFATDQLKTLDACRDDPSLHPALATADFSNAGAFGHSMGAMASIAAGGGTFLKTYRPGEHNIKAVVSMHTCQDVLITGGTLEVPTLFTTGSTDDICADGCTERYYGESKQQKIMVNIKGAGHFEPSNLGDNCEKDVIAYFFSCWLRGEYCDKVYGSSGKEICNLLTPGHTTKQCKVEGSGPSAGITV